MQRIIKSVSHDKNNYSPGAVLFKEGSTGNTFFLIKKGEVNIVQNHGQSSEKNLATIGAGHVLGEVSAIDGGPRTATAIAKTEVEVAEIDGKTLKYQIKQCPHWFGAIVLDLVERLRKTDELLSQNGINHAARHTSLKATVVSDELSSSTLEEKKK